jgi:hypothetical protein
LIHQALLTAAYSAREYLIMTTPYFVPATTCCTRSVPPRSAGRCQHYFAAQNDSLLVGWASRAFFTELLAAGVKIYQFEGGLLHTKSVLVDGELSLVGTVNWICAACGSTLKSRWSLMMPDLAAIWRRCRMIIFPFAPAGRPAVGKTTAVAADCRTTVLLL